MAEAQGADKEPASPSAPVIRRKRLTVYKNRTIGDELEYQQTLSGEKLEQTRRTKRAHPALGLSDDDDGKFAIMGSISGAETTDRDRFLPYFAEKSMNYFGESKICCLPLSIGIVCHRGHKPDQPNQDDYFALAKGDWLLCGVCDGHGTHGHVISHFVQTHLPKLLVERLGSMTGNTGPDSEAWRTITTSCFEEVHTALTTEQRDLAQNSGTTATVVLYCPGSMHVAWVGDSAASIATRQGSNFEIQELIDSHRPTRPDEKARILAAGGHVTEVEGSPARLQTPEVGLAMSRALGDLEAAPYGLSHTPEHTDVIFDDPPDTYVERLILICSDGVWDWISAQQAVGIIGRFGASKAQDAAEKLVQKSQHRWQEHEDVVDDITAMLLWTRDSLDEDGGILSPRHASSPRRSPRGSGGMALSRARYATAN